MDLEAEVALGKDLKEQRQLFAVSLSVNLSIYLPVNLREWAFVSASGRLRKRASSVRPPLKYPRSRTRSNPRLRALFHPDFCDHLQR